MKTAKLIIGIVSIVLSIIVFFQSCVVTVGDALLDGEGVSGPMGAFMGLVMLIGGIVAIATRNSRGGAIFCAILYGLVGVIGLANIGSFADLVIWSGLCLIFAIVFLISAITYKPETVAQTTVTSAPQPAVEKEEIS